MINPYSWVQATHQSQIRCWDFFDQHTKDLRAKSLQHRHTAIERLTNNVQTRIRLNNGVDSIRGPVGGVLSMAGALTTGLLITKYAPLPFPYNKIVGALSGTILFVYGLSIAFYASEHMVNRFSGAAFDLTRLTVTAARSSKELVKKIGKRRGPPPPGVGS